MVWRTRELIGQVGDVRDAAILVRRAHASEHLVNEALRSCRALEREQFELKQEAAEVHLRTQRRGGELLAQLTKHRGGRPSKNVSAPGGPAEQLPTLRELGIDTHESHRWQRIASVPAPLFEEYVTEMRARREELTIAGVLAMARALRGQERDDAEMDSRPSSQSALRREYEQLKPHALSIIWLDPLALAASLTLSERLEERADVERLLLWLTEFRDALTRGAAVHLRG